VFPKYIDMTSKHLLLKGIDKTIKETVSPDRVCSIFQLYVVNIIIVIVPYNHKTNLVPVSLSIQSNDHHGRISEIAISIEGEVLVLP